jgi:hypothetical protein
VAPKIINLDSLIPEKQFFILDGDQHELLAASVEVYMKVLKSRERMKSSSEEVEQMQQAIMLITLCCPTITEARLNRLPLKALTALADAIQGQMEEQVDEAGGEEAPATDAP